MSKKIEFINFVEKILETTNEEIDYVIDTLPPIIEKINGYSPYQKELALLRK